MNVMFTAQSYSPGQPAFPKSPLDQGSSYGRYCIYMAAGVLLRA
jgi:hypothetical protein